MCGRFVRKVEIDEIKNHFDIDVINCDLVANFNITPGQKIAVITKSGKIHLESHHWGFIPSFSKSAAYTYQIINARAETLATKPSFKEAFMQRRCLIIASGFYEWNKEGNKKIPYFFSLKSDTPFAFAGIWNYSNDLSSRTCAIITTEANTIVSRIHKRMPVILTKPQESTWIDENIKDNKILSDLLLPYSDNEMKSYQVSTYVNSPKNNDEKCIASV